MYGFVSHDSGFLGIGFHLKIGSVTSSNAFAMAIVIPWWLLFALVTLPAYPSASRALVRMRAQRRRARHGLCMKCGYDLRATPDRCPECGTASAALGLQSD
jgi:hypothetical protein